MLILLYIIHVLICFFLIAVVLLQQGSGADLSVFGGGATQTAFGARGATNVLHKATVASFIAFMVTTLAIGAIQVREGGGVLGGLPDAAEVEAIDESAAAGAEAGTEEATPAGAVEAEEAEGVIAVEPSALESSGVESSGVEPESDAASGSDG